MTPLISVIIPVDNVEPYIERAILSVLDQTMTECECLVIDDCGSDGSMDIVRSLQQRHPAGSKIRVIRQARNGGLGEARNTGIDLAKGEYVYFLDGDDYIAPDCIEQLYCAAEKYHADFATGIFLLEDPQGQIVSGEVKTDLPVLYSGRGNLYIARIKGILGSETNTVYRRSFLIEHHIRNIHRIGEDHFWCLQTAVHGTAAVYVPGARYYYCLRDGSITNGYNRSRFPDSLVDAFYDNYFDCLRYADSLPEDKQPYGRALAAKLGITSIIQIIRSNVPDKRDKINAIYRVFPREANTLTLLYRDRPTRFALWCLRHPAGLYEKWVLFNFALAGYKHIISGK